MWNRVAEYTIINYTRGPHVASAIWPYIVLFDHVCVFCWTVVMQCSHHAGKTACQGDLCQYPALLGT